MPRCAALFLFALFVPVASAGPPHPVTPADYQSLSTITGFAIDPSGTKVAYCEARWNPETDDRKADLWVVGLGENQSPRRITQDRANDRMPVWYNESIFTLANRRRAGETKPPFDGSTQVWKSSEVSGQPFPIAVTRVEGGITGCDIASDVDALYYTVDVTIHDEDPFAALRKNYGKVVYGTGVRKVSELYRLDIKTWRTEKVLAAGRYIREFAVTSDGRRVAMITAHDDTVIRSEGESRVDVFEVATGRVVTPETAPYRAKAATPHAWLENLTWNGDGDKVAFCAIFDGYPTELVVLSSSESGWTTELKPRPFGIHVHGYGSPLNWDRNTLYYIAEKDGRTIVLPVGIPFPEKAPDRVVTNFDISGNAKIGVLLKGDSAHFPDLYAVGWEPGGKERRLTDLYSHTKDWLLPKVSYINWKAKDGSIVGGVLELPADYQPGTKLPLVVAIHGGPTTSAKAEMAFDPLNGRLYFAAAGYAVLAPNYRGSTGSGDKFVTDLLGHENDIEVKDILAGIQHLVKEGIADPNRVAVMGWSNGGYLTNCLITLKDPPVKFRAASSGAGIVDTVAEWGFNDEPGYPWVLKKGHPWETPEIYKKASPTYGLGNVKTPTLIHVGGADERCPPGQSRMLFRAIREYDNVPCELCIYPGEPHGPTKLSNRKAKMEWDLAWFDKYVKGR
ncbi:MAG TPA: prolyl oligopeptidase family serine peptidase [Fimbriiglobus sp.]